MDEAFIAERITELRLARNISEYQMSLELGQSKGYVQGITSGKCLPSMAKLPFVGAVSPSSIFMVVDFPAPLGPSNP